MPGAKRRDNRQGNVIGAGSVVIQSIPAGVIAAGNLARVIRAVSGLGFFI
jgi:acetyltransferase-like isoleucine patch superfamily enzyme